MRVTVMSRATGIRNRIFTTVVTTSLVLLTACGGSTDVAGIQGSGSPAPAATATTVGPITGFGSIFVDGVEYSTAGAQISVDGQAATEAQLSAGQIVDVNGSVNSDGKTGAATQVTFNGDVVGPVTQVDTSSSTFVALGQTVRIMPSTLLDSSIQPADISGFQAGTVVEVSGFADSTGAIVACRVDVKAVSSQLQVKGVVQALDSTGHTFKINALTVDDSLAMVTGTLANGSTVLVQGTSVSSSSGALLATRIEVLPGLGATANERADIQGVITTFTSNADFVVNGQHVTTSATTDFVLHNVTLGVNVEVDVQGQFDSSGTLVAQKVEVRPQSQSLVSGFVDSVGAASNTLTILGVTVTTGTSTQFDDKSNQHVRMFTLADVKVGDYVEADGVEGPPGTLTAAVLQRRNGNGNGNTRPLLRGVALNLVQPNFTVLGVTVATTAQTKFIGAGGSANNAAAFFGQAANHVVEVSGTFTSPTLTADKVTLEQ
jgi:Domain of unknown function (DUF5666)